LFHSRKRLKQQHFSVEKIQAQPVSPPELFSWEEKFGPDWNNESIPLDKFIGNYDDWIQTSRKAFG
jgi:hypothetical protein